MANHHERPPQVADLGPKKPRLFYFEDALNGYAPVPEDIEAGLLDWLYYEAEGEDAVQPEPVEFRRAFMTDAEFDAIPEE